MKKPKNRATSQTQDDLILSAVETHSEQSLPQIYNKLRDRGVNCSISTVWKRVNAQGIQNLAPLKKPLLTEQQRQHRLDWAHNHREYEWDSVIFSDEASFLAYTPVKRVWRRRGEVKVTRTIKHSAKVHVWACMTSKGFGRLFVFKQMLDSNLMCEIYQHSLLPSIQRWTKVQNAHFCLQEDNDPKHTSK